MNAPERLSVATLFFRNRYLLALAVVVTVVAGLSSVISLPRLEDPRITDRNPVVVTAMPGASAERVEALVTEVLEQELQEVAAIKHLESTSRAGVSVIAIELEDRVTSRENQAVFSEIRDKLGDARPQLPAEALAPWMDDKRDPVAYTLILGVRWTSSEPLRLGILDRIAEDLADRLRNVKGTELVRLFGAPEEEITVTLRDEEFAELGLHAADVARLIRAADSKTPAGVLRGKRSDVILEVDGELDSVERIRAIPLSGAAGPGVLRLGEVAAVDRGWRTPSGEIALVDGDRSILVGVRMDGIRRVDHWAAEVDEVVSSFASHVGDGVTIGPIFEQSRYTSQQLADLIANLIAGAAVVVGVVLVMMGWRLALVIGLALLLVVASVLFGLQLSGNAIHQMSIFGLIIALGLLIDNAIVVTDEIAQNKAAGLTAERAVAAAVRHLFLPLLASTLTTVLAFAPILLLPGGVGDFVGSIAESVLLALVASFAIAMTVTAGLAGIFAQPRDLNRRSSVLRDGIASAGLARLYRRGMRLGLRLPVAAVLLASFLPVSGFIVARSLDSQFFPPVDRDMFEVRVWMPTQTSTAFTAGRALEIESVIRSYEEIERVQWMVGSSFPTVYYNLVMDQDNASHYAHGIVTTNSGEATKAVIAPLQRALDERFPGAQIIVRQFGQGPPIKADVEFRIYGPDTRTLQDLGDWVRLEMQSHPDVLHTQASMPRGEPKLWLDADEDEARFAGLTLEQIAGQLQANLEGLVGGSVIEGLERMPVRVRFDDDVRGDPSRIASTRLVRPGLEDWIPLEAVGRLNLRPELGGITRYDGIRTNIIRGYTLNGALPIEVTKAVMARLDTGGIEMPAGYTVELGGAAEEDAAAKANLVAYAPVLITLTLATLILTFNSVWLAGLLGIVAVLSIGLGLLSTWLIGFPVSFNTILGTLGLIGLAFNNSIVVLAAIRADAAARSGDRDAITERVVGTTRHILATTLTTIGGFLPLLLFVGGDFWPALAIVLAGGVGGSMILALVLVPAVYAMTANRQPVRWRLPGVGRLTRATAVTAALLFASACAVGPKYVVPSPELPSAFEGVPAQAEATPDPSVDWWTVFGDTLLSELVEGALAGNHDMRVAAARVRQARALRRVAGSRSYPSVGLDAGYAAFQLSENGVGAAAQLAEQGLADLDGDLFRVGFDVGWEIDVFGGVKRGKEAADARIGVAVAGQRGVLVSTVAEIARNYAEVRGAQRRLAVLEARVTTQAETLRLVRDRFETGIGSELDVARAEAELRATEARRPRLRTAIRAGAHRLSVLTGRHPTELLERLLETDGIPTVPDVVPVGLPADLIRRRPDVQAAERQLAAATAEVGMAMAERYPKFLLGGSVGLESGSFLDLFQGASGVLFVGPRTVWSLFQGGRNRALVAAANAEVAAAEARFERAVLIALEDVETALVAYGQQGLERNSLAEAVRAAGAALDRADALYSSGLTDFLTVLDAQRTLRDLEDELAASEAAVMVRAVALFKALGGGWEKRLSEAAAEAVGE